MTDAITHAADLATALQETAMLASCRVSRLGLMRTDRQASGEVNLDKKAEKNAARVVVNRLAGADDHHKAITSLQDAARATVDRYTMTWDQGGWRLLPNVNFAKLMGKLVPLRDGMNQAMAAYREDMPNILARARAAIGDLDVPLPTMDEVAGAYDFRMEFQPLPDGSRFRNMPAGTVEALSKHIEARCKASWGQAQADVAERVDTAMRYLTERLAAFDDRVARQSKGEDVGRLGVFRDTLVSSVTELADELPALNVIGDPRITALATQLHGIAQNLAPQALREQQGARDDARSKAQAIIDNLATWKV